MYYTYHCENCGDFDVTKSIHDKALESCPDCGEKVYQLYDGLSVMWKGRFRFMKGNPEIDIDKIEAEQNARELKKIKGKIHRELSEVKAPKYYQGGING